MLDCEAIQLGGNQEALETERGQSPLAVQMARRKSGIKRRKANSQHTLVVAVLIVSVLVLSLLIMIFTAPSQTAKFSAPQQVEVPKPMVEQKAEVPAPMPAENLPDLQVQLFSTYSGETKSAVRITTDVMNKGDADIKTNYKVTYGYEEKKGTYRVDYVQAGDATVTAPHNKALTKPIVFLWIPEKAGVYDFKVCADYANEIKEGNEGNNCAKTVITVKDYAKYG